MIIGDAYDVTPAKAGVQSKRFSWIPACAGMTSFVFASLLISLSSCVPLDQLPPGAIPASFLVSTQTATAFGALDLGERSITSIHFTLKGYSEYDLRPISSTAETLFNRIGSDTGLYSFLASENLTIVCYRDRSEYLQKTRQPGWSRVVFTGQSLYLCPGDDLDAHLAHELTHVIMNSYLGDAARKFRWLIEGLAMMEEVSNMAESDRSAYQTSKSSQLRQERLPFSQMTFFMSNTEEKRRTDAWFQQVESVVSYLLSQGSPLAFAQMMSELRSGAEIDRAIADAYPGKFRALSDLETAWKYTI
jgi:hypothetical protein